ncbi:MAG: hypothetical protein F6J97_21190 [Leptolyngbya sp. SIO4C1]|nr:hypothetical protein [Leptolyngbya sp. SIO4C1]
MNVLIDLREVGLELDQAELEERSLLLADELRSGNLAESTRLARQAELPDGAKSGALAFIGGVLMAEVSRENLKQAIDFLGHRFYGKTLTLEYKADGLECAIEYRNQADIEQALATVERLETIRIRVKD